MSEKYDILNNILSKHFILSKKSNENEIILKCPYCGDKDDEYHNKTGHYHLYMEVDTGKYHCFLCGKKGRNIYQFIKENKNKFTTSDIVKLSKIYTFEVKRKVNFKLDNNILSKNENIKKLIDYLYNNKSNRNIKHLYNRIYIEERDNINFLKTIINKRIIFKVKKILNLIPDINELKLSYIKTIYKNKEVYVIPLLFDNGFQLYIPNNDIRYIIYSNKEKILPNYILLEGKTNKYYIVEGIFDGLKLYNILNMKDNIIVTIGKSNVSNILYSLKLKGITDIESNEYIFAFDNDIEYNEYIGLIKRFKNGYEINNIKILLFKDKKINDIGEIKSVKEYKEKTKIVNYNLFALKEIYDKIIKEMLV